MNARQPVVAGVLLALIAALPLHGCVDAPKVVQGTVVSNDLAKHQLVVKDELPPSEELSFSTQGAELGADPKPGDLVRLAYREHDGQRRATRIANLSRQSEIKTKGKEEAAH